MDSRAGVRSASLALAVCLLCGAASPAEDTPFDPARDFVPGVRPRTAAHRAAMKKLIVSASPSPPGSTLKPNGGSAAQPPAAPLPDLVDNSAGTNARYFPPVRSQGTINACTAWAAAYYYNTYTQARDEDVDVSAAGDSAVCSPAFLYPQMNNSQHEGSYTEVAMLKLNDVGCCSWATMPYTGDRNDPANYTTWPTEAAWLEALAWRTEQTHDIDGGTQAGLMAVKQHLADGHIGATDFWTYENFVSYYPNSTTGIDGGVYYCPSGAFIGGHSVAIVGYDDNKTYFDHRDGRQYSGAFLMVNMWGADWGTYNTTAAGSKGFFWVAYRAFLEDILHTDPAVGVDKIFGPAVWYNSDRDDYRPRLYAVAGLNHANRGQLAFFGGVGDGAAPDWTSHYLFSYDNTWGGGDLALDDTARVVIDLTDGSSYVPDGAAVEVFVGLDVTSDAATDGTITSAEFWQDLDDYDGAAAQAAVSADPTVTVAPGAVGYASASVTLDKLTVLTVTLPASAMEDDGVLAGAGTIGIDYARAADLVVTLVSSDTAEVLDPGAVTIPAGDLFAAFDIAVQDDGAADYTKTVTIDATAADSVGGSGSMLVYDVATKLTLTLPTDATEGDGTLSTMGTVQIPDTAGADIAVTLSSGDETEVTVPASVTIPAGSFSVSFPVTAVDDGQIDGTQSVTIEATAAGRAPATGSITVADDETMELTLTLPANASENGGTLAGAGNVSIPGTYPTDIVVALASDDLTEAQVPAFVTIPAGSTAVGFDIMMVDDTEVDGTVTVTITASRTGWTGDSATFDVFDNAPAITFFQLYDITTESTEYSNDYDVTVMVWCSSDPTQMRLAETKNGLESASWQAFSYEFTHTFPDGEGDRTLWCEVMNEDGAGPAARSTIRIDTSLLDSDIRDLERGSGGGGCFLR